MDMNDLKPNSNAYKGQQQRVQAVTKGNVVKKQRSLGRKFASFFFEDMTFKEAMAMFVVDRLFPDLKDGLYNLCDGFLESFFYSGSKRPAARRTGSSTTYTSYNSMSNNNGRSDKNYRSTSNRVANNFDDITFESRQDAEAVLDALSEACEKYKEVSIGDFYDAASVKRNGFTDNNFGWTDLRTAYITRSKGRWQIVMPKVIELN